MMGSHKAIGRWLASTCVASTVLLSGCADGVELNGRIFDWMGVSPAAMDARKREPQLADRAPLVMPPDSKRLAEPGSDQAPAKVAWPDDPEQRKIRVAEERERLHMEYCRGDRQWKERALNKGEGTPRSPYGPCPSLFGGAINSTLNTKQ